MASSNGYRDGSTPSLSGATMRWEVYELATGNTVALVRSERFAKRIVRWERFFRSLKTSAIAVYRGRRSRKAPDTLAYRELADPDAAWKGGAA